VLRSESPPKSEHERQRAPVVAPPSRLPTSQQVQVIEPRGQGLRSRAQELWVYRGLLYYFVITSIRFSYKATRLQWLWLVIRPLAPVIAGTFILHKMAGISADNIPYPLFIVAGMAIFALFEESLIWITRSFQIHRGILKRLYFPRLLVPVASSAPGVAEFVIYFGLILVLALYFFIADGYLHLTVGLHSLLLVAAMAMAFTFAVGIGLFTSILGSEQRDIRFALRYVCRFWWFLTPIMYPFSFVPEEWRWTLLVNPMATVVELFRIGLFGTSNDLDTLNVVVTLVVIGVTLLAGLWFFYRQESRVADRL
jgi:lipopolysaccharide transport system permease protein